MVCIITMGLDVIPLIWDVQWCYYALVGHGVGHYMLSTDVIVPVGFRSKYQQLFGYAQMLLC